MEQKQVSIAIVGAGNRGSGYAQYAQEHPDLCKVVAVAEPREITRNNMAALYSIPSSNVFADWKELAQREKLADAVVICTLDQQHKEPAIAFANLGYHILLEKPMATNEKDCRDIVEAIEKNNVIMAIGHVMRYTPYSRKIKSLVDSGALGELISVQHLEPIGWFHHAHSYVRGNWRREDETAPILLTKSCHDIDWLSWIVGSPCTHVSSFGSLKHFTKSQKPEGAGSRCLDCKIERDCPYSAKKIYLERVQQGKTGWPVKVLVEGTATEESVTKALQEGPYGRCVYECDNDVPDNQVVNLQFKGGQTASFTMVAFSQEVCVRKTRIFGTRGQLEGDGRVIKLFDFNTQKETVWEPIRETKPPDSKMTGHDFGDYYLMKDFIEAVATGDRTKILSTPQETLQSHVLVFRAEEARRKEIVASLDW